MKYLNKITTSKAIHLLLIAAVPLLFTACADGGNNMNNNAMSNDAMNTDKNTQMAETNMDGEDWLDFEQWDADNSGVIEQNEFSEGLFNTFDANTDGLISEEEWGNNQGIFEDANFGFDDWDANNDGMLDMSEFETGINEEGLFENYDTDNNDLLEEGEYNSIFEPGS